MIGVWWSGWSRPGGCLVRTTAEDIRVVDLHWNVLLHCRRCGWEVCGDDIGALLIDGDDHLRECPASQDV